MQQTTKLANEMVGLKVLRSEAQQTLLARECMLMASPVQVGSKPEYLE